MKTQTVKNLSYAITAKLGAGWMIVTVGKNDAFLVHPKTDKEVLLVVKKGGGVMNRFDKVLGSDAPKSVAAILDERAAKAAQGPWVPACGGTETPFKSRSGRTLLYCYQPSTGAHAYLDVGTDLFLSDEEAAAHLA